MGIQINIGDHVSPDPYFVRVPQGFVPKLRWARERAIKVAKNLPSADRYFLQLPAKRTLRALLEDGSIWINYHPTLTDYGTTSLQHSGELALGKLAFMQGKWMLLGTLIHELAHVAGATDQNRTAELTLVHCGLGHRSELGGKDDPRTPFDPRVVG